MALRVKIMGRQGFKYKHTETQTGLRRRQAAKSLCMQSGVVKSVQSPALEKPTSLYTSGLLSIEEQPFRTTIKSVQYLHFKDKEHIFDNNNVHILNREDRWFETVGKEAIYMMVNMKTPSSTEIEASDVTCLPFPMLHFIHAQEN